MLKKINDILAGVPMTMVGGIFLIMSLVIRKTKGNMPVDPAWVTVIICGIPLLYLAVWRILSNQGIRKISSALLITIAMVAAVVIGDLFAAGEVAFIMELGAILEDMTTRRAKKGLKKLIGLTPQKGRLIQNGEEKIIPADAIKEKYILRVLPGETIPVDGVIISGETSIDQSILTGESIPVDKTIDDSVFCGTMNCFGTIDMRATKVGEDSSLHKLIRMVEAAEKKQALTQRIADVWASWLVPVALMIAVVTLLVTKDIVRAVTVLVVFCPCALVLSTPTAIMAAVGQATKHGVIIKSGEALEKMGKVNTIAFDKTGTLTYGRLEVSDIVTFDGSDENDVLAVAASAEAKSEHPLGKAIVLYAKARNMPLFECNNFGMTAGKGIYAEINEKEVLCGKEGFLLENGIKVHDHVKKKIRQFRTEGKVSILVAENGIIKGGIALTDVLRDEARDMVHRLSDMKTKTVLLTGDNKATGEYFAKQVGITEVKADLLPEKKVEHITELQKEGYVCMIGDGVNDAPALKIANVGVAMGSMGSDIAVEAADIALTTDDISKIPYLKWLSNVTIRTIKFAITLSMCINFVAILFSVTGVLTPTTGALVHNCGSCLVVLIAALLYDRKYE